MVYRAKPRIPEWTQRYIDAWPHLACRREMSGSVSIADVRSYAEMKGLDPDILLDLVDFAFGPAQEKIDEKRRKSEKRITR